MPDKWEYPWFAAWYLAFHQPAESNSGLFGGNSNWRGPIWMPVNYLLIESLQQFYHYDGDDLKIECPTGSGQYLTLNQIADELSQRLIAIFARDAAGRRAVFGGQGYFQTDPRLCISKQGFRCWVLGVGLRNAARPTPNTQHPR